MRRPPCRCWPLALALQLAATAAADTPPEPPRDRGLAVVQSLDADERARLERGEIVERELAPESEGALAFCSLRVLPLPPGVVWPVLRDCERFAEFLPRVKRSSRGTAPDGAPTCRLETDMPLPLGDVVSEVRVALEWLPGGGYRRSWTLLSGDYYENRGSWTVLPWGEDGARSLVVNEAEARPKSAVPAFVLRAARRYQLPRTWRAIEDRARSLAPPGAPDIPGDASPRR